jgi:hypothetical protein
MMKKALMALGLALAVAAGAQSVSADNLWKYSDTLTIDMSEAKVTETTDGHQILTFSAVEEIEGGTCTYEYVYDRTAGTIQVKSMEKETKRLHYTSNFSPESVNSPNQVIRDRAKMAEQVYQRKVRHEK